MSDKPFTSVQKRDIMYTYKDKEVHPMPATEAMVRAAIKYNKTHVQQIKFNFNKIYDADIISHLNKQPNKQGYIKQLIRADIARANSEKKEEEKHMKTWFIVDETADQIDAINTATDDAAEAVRLARAKWDALSEHDKARRVNFYLALGTADETGDFDHDHAVKYIDIARAESVLIKAHEREISDEMVKLYRASVESEGRIQYRLYIWSDGTLETLEDVQGGTSFLQPRDFEPRKLYLIDTICAGPGFDLWSAAPDGIPDDESERESLEQELVDWYVNSYEEGLSDRLYWIIREAEQNESIPD